MAEIFYSGVDLQGQRAQNAGDASAATDLVTFQQLQNYLNGLSWKRDVRVATTTNGTLATAYAAGQTVDGVTLTAGMRVLVKDQTTGSENGIYVVAASGAPTRATDAATSAQLQNAAVYVSVGSVNADRNYVQAADDVTVGTTALVWARQGLGQSYTQGNGITISGNIVTAVAAAGGGLSVDGTGVRVDRSRTPQLYAQSLAAAAANTSQTVTHGLATLRVGETVIRNSDGKTVRMDVNRISSSAVTVTSGAAMAAGDFDIVLFG